MFLMNPRTKCVKITFRFNIDIPLILNQKITASLMTLLRSKFSSNDLSEQHLPNLPSCGALAFRGRKEIQPGCRSTFLNPSERSILIYR